MRKFTKLDQFVDGIISKYEAGMSTADLSDAYSVGERTMYSFLSQLRKKGKIDQKSYTNTPNVLDSYGDLNDYKSSTEIVSEQELIKLLSIYKTRTQIAKKLGISTNVISRLIAQYGIIDNEYISKQINEALKTMLCEVTPYKNVNTGPKGKGDTLVIQITDVHGGKVIKDQSGNVIYDANICKSRMDKLIVQILKLLDNNIKKGVDITDVVILSTGDLANGENIYATQAYEQELAPPKQVMLIVEVLMKLILSLIDRKLNIRFYGIKGNHGRCHSKDTRLLTIKGYKNYDELKEGDLIPTWNIEDNKIEYVPINSISIYDKENKMIEFKDKTSDILVTDDHAMLVKSEKTNQFERKYAGSIVNNYNNVFPTTIKSQLKEYPIGDEWLELLGWVLTDSHINKYGYISLYQSKEYNKIKIEKLLGDFSVSYRKYDRDRDIKEICGRKLKNKCLLNTEYHIHAEDSREIMSYLKEGKQIQTWMYELSDRQVGVLLSSIVDADAHTREARICKDGYTRKEEKTIWGESDFLFSLQGLLVTHGINCSVNTQKTTGNSYLQIRKSENQYVKKENTGTVSYKDTVWCVNVKNHTIFTERNGKPLISGNTGKDTDPSANWDLMIYMVLDNEIRARGLEKKVYIEYAETDYMTLDIRGHGYLIRHRAPEQADSPSGRVKFNEWSRQHNVRAVVYGHFHHFGLFDCDGVRVFRGGSVPGGDDLSESMAKDSDPTQLVWGVNDNRVMTFFYAVDLANE